MLSCRIAVYAGILVAFALLTAAPKSATAGGGGGGGGGTIAGRTETARVNLIRRYKIEAIQAEQAHIDALNDQIKTYTKVIIFRDTLDLAGKLSRVTLTVLKTWFFGADPTSLAHGFVTVNGAYTQAKEIVNEIKSLNK